MLNRKIFLRITLNSALGIFLIFVWSRFVNLAEVFNILKTVDLKFVLVFFGLFIFSGVLRSLRLKLLLKEYPLPLKDAVMLNFLSQFLSFMIPIRAGEITKSVYLTSQYQTPLSKSLVWVFIDRFLDFWVAILFLGVLLPLVSINLPAKFINIIFILLITLSLLVVVALTSEKILKKSTTFLSKFLIVGSIKIWFVTITHNIIEGFAVLRRPFPGLLSLIGLTILATISDSLVWLVIFKSFNFNLGFFTSLWGDSLTALTFLIPAAPGYVGSAEAAGLAVFSGVLNIERNLASAALVLFHILTLLTILVLGLSSLYLLKFDLSLVWKRIKGE